MRRSLFLARNAVRRHEQTGISLELVIADAIDAALAEAGVRPPDLPTEVLPDRDITPAELAALAGIDRDTAYRRLQRACLLGHAERPEPGRYRITARNERSVRYLLARRQTSAASVALRPAGAA